LALEPTQEGVGASAWYAKQTRASLPPLQASVLPLTPLCKALRAEQLQGSLSASLPLTSCPQGLDTPLGEVVSPTVLLCAPRTCASFSGPGLVTVAGTVRAHRRVNIYEYCMLLCVPSLYQISWEPWEVLSQPPACR
jgi:hypothetical protein